MAVMKVCCGCMSTRSGTLAILLLYIVLYIAAIVVLGIKLGNDEVPTYYVDNVLNQVDCMSGENKDAFWCTAMFDSQYDIKTYAIVAVIIIALMLVFALVALFGTSRGSQWPLLPWIVIEFVRLFIMLGLFVMTIIVWAVYMGAEEDSSYIIATGVIGAAVLAFHFYIWLCVVSYFQLLREIAQIGNDHKVVTPVHGHHTVTPFVVDSDFDNEYPCDNLSENTTKEYLEDDISSPVKDNPTTEITSVAPSGNEANE